MTDETLPPSPDVKVELLDEAKRIVTGARRKAYGAPEDNFARIARLWNAHRENLDLPPDIKPQDVPIYMDLMKTARLAESPAHRDSILDKIGYTACYAEMVLPGKEDC